MAVPARWDVAGRFDEFLNHVLIYMPGRKSSGASTE
jgi:hypothetical protein